MNRLKVIFCWKAVQNYIIDFYQKKIVVKSNNSRYIVCMKLMCGAYITKKAQVQ